MYVATPLRIEKLKINENGRETASQKFAPQTLMRHLKIASHQENPPIHTLIGALEGPNPAARSVRTVFLNFAISSSNYGLEKTVCPVLDP